MSVPPFPPCYIWALFPVLTSPGLACFFPPGLVFPSCPLGFSVFFLAVLSFSLCLGAWLSLLFCFPAAGGGPFSRQDQKMCPLCPTFFSQFPNGAWLRWRADPAARHRRRFRVPRADDLAFDGFHSCICWRRSRSCRGAAGCSGGLVALRCPRGALRGSRTVVSTRLSVVQASVWLWPSGDLWCIASMCVAAEDRPW